MPAHASEKHSVTFFDCCNAVKGPSVSHGDQPAIPTLNFFEMGAFSRRKEFCKTSRTSKVSVSLNPQ